MKKWLITILLSLLPVLMQAERVYPIVPELNVRQSPTLSSNVIFRLRHSRWIEVLPQEEKVSKWLNVKTPTGKTGYVFKELCSDFWVKIYKKEHQVILMKDLKKLKVYPAAFGFNPRDDKIKLGDGCTPEGRFYVCRVIEGPRRPEVYGPVSLRISYPNIEDARRGLLQKLITHSQYRAIVRAVHRGTMPPQNTKLGGSIKLHGGDPSTDSDWTLGCIAVKNSHLMEIFAKVPRKLAMVEIYNSKQQDSTLNEDLYVNSVTLKTCEKLIKKGCKYTGKATGILPLGYPMGDFDSSQGVCTDLVIRALRGVKIDLQALMYEDIEAFPQRYPNIKRKNPNIDHRRTRNLKRYFDHNAITLTMEPPAKSKRQWLPGDVVLMDTGIRNGTIYDHIGIVSSRKKNGIPLVINLWTVGWKLNEMELLKGDYPKIVGHYRLFSPLYYGAN